MSSCSGRRRSFFVYDSTSVISANEMVRNSIRKRPEVLPAIFFND